MYYPPYLILSSLPILHWVLTKQDAPFKEHIFTADNGMWGEYLRPAIRYLWTGSAVAPFWFIPFIMLIFLLSPLIVKFIRLSYRTQTTVLIFLILISLAVHRPAYNLSPTQALAYFASVFVFGSYCSIHREQMYKFFGGYEWLLLIPITGLTIYQVWQHSYFGALAGDSFEPIFDVSHVREILACVFFMVFLHRFEDHYFKWLYVLAKASFPIYL